MNDATINTSVFNTISLTSLTSLTSTIITMALGAIIGLVLGRYLLFKKILYKGPNSNDVRKNVYKVSDDEYVRFDIEMCVCPPSYKNMHKAA